MWVAVMLVCEGLLIDSCKLVQHDQIYFESQMCEEQIQDIDDWLTEQGYYAKGSCTKLYAEEEQEGDLT